MCCLFSSLCQHQSHQHHPHHHGGVGEGPRRERQKFAYRNRRSAAVVAKLLPCLFFGALLLNLSLAALPQTESETYLPELRIQELHNIAIRLNHTIDADKNPCESYFDYVCGLNRPLFSIMGHLPDNNELIQLLTELQEDPEQFEAKQKLMDFFISCNSIKALDDCYRETFEYFRPLFGYLISKNYIDNSPNEELTLAHTYFFKILDSVIRGGEQSKRFRQEPTLTTLRAMNNSFIHPQMYFRADTLNKEYESLKIYRESYQHNIKNFDKFRRRNSTYVSGRNKIVLDWTLYLYQSRNKPISYFYPTLSTHLWMSVYNRSEVREYEPKRLAEISECLKLPQFVNALEEARILAIVYVKSFNSAWKDYTEWISASPKNELINAMENNITSRYKLNNEKLFFTLYAQNFCEFGRDLAENVFFVGLKQNVNFTKAYSCSYQIERNYECV